jgi:DNA gyrase/topoisomerase IV subunit A
MFTEKEVTLLKQSIDITVANISGMSIKSTTELERNKLREENNNYFQLIGKIDSLIKKEK